MPGTLKMKYVRLAVDNAKDENRSDLPETIFGQKFSSARNHSLFLTHILLNPHNFFNLLYSISKIDLPRYSCVSYKNWMDEQEKLSLTRCKLLSLRAPSGVASTEILAEQVSSLSANNSIFFDTASESTKW